MKRQIIEGVQAVVKIFRHSQVTGKVPLQVFDRRAGADNVRFEGTSSDTLLPSMTDIYKNTKSWMLVLPPSWSSELRLLSLHRNRRSTSPHCHTARLSIVSNLSRYQHSSLSRTDSQISRTLLRRWTAQLCKSCLVPCHKALKHLRPLVNLNSKTSSSLISLLFSAPAIVNSRHSKRILMSLISSHRHRNSTVLRLSKTPSLIIRHWLRYLAIPLTEVRRPRCPNSSIKAGNNLRSRI